MRTLKWSRLQLTSCGKLCSSTSDLLREGGKMCSRSCVRCKTFNSLICYLSETDQLTASVWHWNFPSPGEFSQGRASFTGKGTHSLCFLAQGDLTAFDMPVTIYRTPDNIIWEITHLCWSFLEIRFLKCDPLFLTIGYLTRNECSCQLVGQKFLMSRIRESLKAPQPVVTAV